MTGPTVRDHLDDVVDELIPTIALEHDGYLLPRPAVQALVAFLGDLRDMHDERAIDVECWPTLAGFCDEVLTGHETPAPGGARCSRPYAHPAHDTDTGACVGLDRASLDPTEVKTHAETARVALRGDTS